MNEAAVDAVGGALGSCIGVAVTYPLTTVSTWQALAHRPTQEEDARNEQEQLRRARLVPSPLRELIVYARTRGLNALYAGFKPCLLATAVSQGVYFYLYSTLRQAVVAHTNSTAKGGTARNQDVGVLGSTLVASLAGVGCVLATNPVWVIMTQMQALQKSTEPQRQKRGALQVAGQLLREGGLLAFWKGLAPALVMVSNPTIQFILYEWLTARLLEYRRRMAPAARRVVLGAKDAFLLSALAKLGATLVTYPMLVIKSRLQAINAATAADARYSGVGDAVMRILRSEGLGGLFKGMQAKMVQTVLGAALMLAIKEQVHNTARALLRQQAMLKHLATR